MENAGVSTQQTIAETGSHGREGKMNGSRTSNFSGFINDHGSSHERMSMKLSELWVGLLIAGALSVSSGACSREKGEQVALDQVPAAAKAVIEKESQGGQIRGVKKETEGGKLAYSAEIVKDGKEAEIHVGADGTVIPGEGEEEDQDGD
jgi:hypothetical protein